VSSHPRPAGRVVSIHLHPVTRGAPLHSVPSVEAVAGQGLQGDLRYFGRRRRNGEPSRRQVTLIEREMVNAHANALGLTGIAPGVARSNIETEGIDLATLIGRQLRIGTALLGLVEHREPCEQMDAIAPGLRARMAPPCQGVIAVVVESGSIRVGDPVTVIWPDRNTGVAIPRHPG